MLHLMGLRVHPDYPNAKGEVRSVFAAPLLSTGLACLLLQDPIALQPGLNITLAIGWTVCVVGRIMQIVLDGGYRKRVYARLFISLVIAGAAWFAAEMPYFVCLQAFSTYCEFPSSQAGWFVFAIALITLLVGLAMLFIPATILQLLRLEHKTTTVFAIGAPRAINAGFYIAIGGVYLVQPQPPDFVALVLAGLWLISGFGRVISLVFDRNYHLYNILVMLLQFGTGLMIAGLVFRVV